MKKFIIGLVGVLFTIAASVVATIAVQHYVLPIQTDEERVWDIAEKVIHDYDNPTFTTTSDAVAFYENLVDGAITDSMIISIPRETYTQISTVLIGRFDNCTPKAILMEYLKNNGKIYQYLKGSEESPDERQIDEFTKAVKVEPDTMTKPGDTVINGQLYRIQRE